MTAIGQEERSEMRKLNDREGSKADRSRWAPAGRAPTVDAYRREFDLPAHGCHRLGMVEVRRPVRGSPPGRCEARYQCYDAAQGDRSSEMRC